MKHTPYWFRVIENAKKRQAEGKQAFTTEQIDKATDWQTCACGRQDPRIPRNRRGVPTDSRLANLGKGFFRNVNRQEPDEALATLLKIEQRSAELLAGLK